MFQVPEIRVKLERKPLVSILILTKDNTRILFRCIESIYEKGGYDNIEIIVGDTGSNYDSRKEMTKFFSKYPDIKIINKLKYNFSKNNNELVNKYVSKDSEILLFCNNDIEMLNNVVEQMLSATLQRIDSIGTVGCQLFFPTGTIQHQGIILTQQNNGGNYKIPQFCANHKNLNTIKYNYIPEWVVGNTGACLMIQKSLFEQIGGFDEKYISVFQDVQLNVETLKLGRKNLCLNTAVALHYESSTRKNDINDGFKLKTDLKERLIPLIKENYELLKPFITKTFLEIAGRN